MKIKRIIALLIALLALISVAGISASAATPTYEVSKQYQKSKYYQNFKKVPLSGDEATDVIAIALSQLGYREGNSNADLGGTSDDGVRDFVEYNVLYGKLDNGQGNGVSYGYYWCASFVNWCLRQADVDVKDSAAAEISCRRWLQKCKDADIYRAKQGYVPEAGDLIFFKDSDSEVSSTHMGIVLYSDRKNVYTIEGNTTDDNSFSGDGSFVALKSYRLNSSYIVGYARPIYEQNDSVPKVDYSGEELSAGLYISQKEIEIFESREMSGSSTKLPAHEVFTVKEIFRDCFRVEYDVDGKTYEGYALIENRAVQMTSFSSLRKVDILDSDGSKIYRTQYLLPATEIITPDVAPEKEGAGFVGWLVDGADSSVEIYAPGETVVSDKHDTVITAFWDANLYTVVFCDESGNVIEEFSGYYGDHYEIPELGSVPKGKEFVRWESRSPIEENIINVELGIIKNNATYYPEFGNAELDEMLKDYAPEILSVAFAGLFVILGIVMMVIIYRKTDNN
jgi:hypothetical protein